MVSLELVGEFFEVTTQVDRDLTTVSKDDRRLGLIKNLGVTFVLLFLPPCGPHLTLLDTGSLETSLLVSPLLGGPTRHRPFASALHLHQRKSRRNLHLQYSAKSQSTPCRQSLVTARSDHPPVLRRSDPQHFPL
jgi:hypothetical protein